MDGGYASKFGNHVKDNAADIICEGTDPPCDVLLLLTRLLGLDPPFILYFPRVHYRIFTRPLRYGKPCSPECDVPRVDVVTLEEKSILC